MILKVIPASLYGRRPSYDSFFVVYDIIQIAFQRTASD